MLPAIDEIARFGDFHRLALKWGAQSGMDIKSIFISFIYLFSDVFTIFSFILSAFLSHSRKFNPCRFLQIRNNLAFWKISFNCSFSIKHPAESLFEYFSVKKKINWPVFSSYLKYHPIIYKTRRVGWIKRREPIDKIVLLGALRFTKITKLSYLKIWE